jgi:aspartate aminotransferase
MKYELATHIANLKPSATEEVDNTIKRMQRAGIRDIISLGVGEPCFDTPIPIVRAAQHALENGMTKYQPTAGDYGLREEICRKLKLENHIDSTVEDIIVTPGAKFAIYLFFQAFIEPGDRVIILDPSWVSHDAIPRMSGAEMVRIPSYAKDDFQPNLDAIRKALEIPAKCIIVNSPCNPTGAVYPKDIIRKIVEMADDQGVLVLSDEIYESLVFEGEPYSPASEYKNVITVNGFSKTYAMTGWRLGYVTGPEEILEGMIKIYQHSASCVTSFAQAGATEALRNPDAQTRVQAMITSFRHKHDLMMDLLQESAFFSCKSAQGAFYCFPSYRIPKPSLDFAKELLEKVHVATLPGSAFGDCGEYHLRLSYAATDEDIVEALDRIESYLETKG